MSESGLRLSPENHTPPLLVSKFQARLSPHLTEVQCYSEESRCIWSWLSPWLSPGVAAPTRQHLFQEKDFSSFVFIYSALSIRQLSVYTH